MSKIDLEDVSFYAGLALMAICAVCAVAAYFAQ
jgi:hypothetical protein